MAAWTCARAWTRRSMGSAGDRGRAGGRAKARAGMKGGATEEAGSWRGASTVAAGRRVVAVRTCARARTREPMGSTGGRGRAGGRVEARAGMGGGATERASSSAEESLAHGMSCRGRIVAGQARVCVHARRGAGWCANRVAGCVVCCPPTRGHGSRGRRAHHRGRSTWRN